MEDSVYGLKGVFLGLPYYYHQWCSSSENEVYLYNIQGAY